jgi:hypothetical protein
MFFFSPKPGNEYKTIKNNENLSNSIEKLSEKEKRNKQELIGNCLHFYLEFIKM